MSAVLERPTTIAPLAPGELRWRCDPETLGFRTTEAVEPLDRVVGQDRGISAINLALQLDDPEYNLFVAGPSGTGRNTAVVAHVKRSAAQRPTHPCRDELCRRDRARQARDLQARGAGAVGRRRSSLASRRAASRSTRCSAAAMLRLVTSTASGDTEIESIPQRTRRSA